MASSDMILYMTFICIVSSTSLQPWYLSSPGIKFVMYFGHRFPLTSHITGHLLSCKMGLLRPSTNTQCVSTQKDKMDRSGQNTIDGNDLWCIILLPYWIIFCMAIKVNTQLFSLQPAYHMWLLKLQITYIWSRLKSVGCLYESSVSYTTYQYW